MRERGRPASRRPRPAGIRPWAAAKRRSACPPHCSAPRAARSAFESPTIVSVAEWTLHSCPGSVPGMYHSVVTTAAGQYAFRSIPVVPIDLARDQSVGTRPIGRRWLSPIDLGHERGPRRRREHAALRIRVDLLRPVEAHPHAGDEIRRVADEPDVGAVVRRARLTARGIDGTAPTLSAAVPCCTTSFITLDHQPRFFRRQHRRRRRLAAPRARLPLLFFDARDRHRRRRGAERRERGVRRDHLDRIDVGARRCRSTDSGGSAS